MFQDRAERSQNCGTQPQQLASADNRKTFESAYNAKVVGGQLVRRDPAYRERILLRDDAEAGRYLTVEVWEDKDSYTQFQGRFADEYKKNDAACGRLTRLERRIGLFERRG